MATSEPVPTVVNPPIKTVGSPIPATPQALNTPDSSCNYFAGTAVGGQAINVDLCSVRVHSPQLISFIYYLNRERIDSEADCTQSTWITLPERQVNRPQSQATQNMLNVICGYQPTSIGSSNNASSQVRTALVFAPPSNVRISPNGAILCSVKKNTTINVYTVNDSWYQTDICGSPGFIHADQIKF